MRRHVNSARNSTAARIGLRNARDFENLPLPCPCQRPFDDDDDDEDWYDDDDEPDDDEPAPCPECGEPVYAITDKCPACGYWLSEADRRGDVDRRIEANVAEVTAVVAARRPALLACLALRWRGFDAEKRVLQINPPTIGRTSPMMHVRDQRSRLYRLIPAVNNRGLRPSRVVGKGFGSRGTEYGLRCAGACCDCGRRWRPLLLRLAPAVGCDQLIGGHWLARLRKRPPAASPAACVGQSSACPAVRLEIRIQPLFELVEIRIDDLVNLRREDRVRFVEQGDDVPARLRRHDRLALRRRQQA